MTRTSLFQRLFAGLWLLACVALALIAGWRITASALLLRTGRPARLPAALPGA